MIGIDAEGWHENATRVDAHPKRIGGAITPETISVHTTDTMPGTTRAIVRSWSTTPGRGACAHFLLDRAGKITQMVSIFRNANHVGGLVHGWFKQPAARGLLHPNTLAVGIEVENAGRLGRASAGVWRHPDTGRLIDAADVRVDARGVGWHKPTPVQMDALIGLVRDLDAALEPMRQGLVCVPDGDYAANQVPWAAVPSARVHGHASLDPVNKTDPGPFIMEALRAAGLIAR